MESLVSSPNVVGGSGERNSYSKQPSKPIFPVEMEAAQFIKTQRYGNHIWNTRESRTFGYFVEYLRMLRISDYSQIDCISRYKTTQKKISAKQKRIFFLIFILILEFL